MIHIHSEGNIIYSEAVGQLDDNDYDQLIPLLQEKIRSHGTIRWYFEMRDFKGWSLSPLWRDMKFDFSNRERLEKVAMVGEERWEHELTRLMQIFASGEIRFFSLQQQQEARRWIQSAG